MTEKQSPKQRTRKEGPETTEDLGASGPEDVVESGLGQVFLQRMKKVRVLQKFETLSPLHQRQTKILVRLAD